MVFKRLFKRKGPVSLKIVDLEKWPQILIREAGLEDDIKEFRKRFENKKKELEESVKRLKDDKVKKEVPERAKEIYEEHSRIIINEIENLLNRSELIDDLFLIETQREELQTMIIIFRDITRKSFSVLKEFAQKELLKITEALNSLEDELINLNPILEKKHFENIIRIKELIDHYRATRKESQEANQELRRIKERIKNINEKKKKIEERIKQYLEKAKPETKELVDEEKRLLEKMHNNNKEQEDKITAEALREVRRRMINDITAMNISEQRRFLEGLLRDEKRLREELEELTKEAKELSLEETLKKIKKELEPLNAKIEGDEIKEDGTADELLN